MRAVVPPGTEYRQTSIVFKRVASSTAIKADALDWSIIDSIKVLLIYF